MMKNSIEQSSLKSPPRTPLSSMPILLSIFQRMNLLKVQPTLYYSVIIIMLLYLVWFLLLSITIGMETSFNMF